MVETNNPEYWHGLAKKGKADDEILIEIENLKRKHGESDSTTIFSKESPKFSFRKEFTTGLSQELKNVFTSKSNFPPEDIKEKTKRFQEEIKEYLVTVHIKKIACEITFDAFPLLKLIKALDTLIDEARFTITPHEILIEFMDPSRICLVRITLSDSSYKFYREAKIYLNIGNFKDVLKSEASDKSSSSLQFGEKTLFLTIKSGKYGSKINRTLDYIDLETEDIPFTHLTSIVYTFNFTLEQQKFQYTMKNLGVYSDIIDISSENQSVKFSENGEIGKGEFTWNEKQLLRLQVSEEENLSSHSLSFLSWVDKITQVLCKKDPIHFSVKHDHPIRIKTDFTQLGDSSLLYFLAPRIPEEDYDDDMEDF